jgi:hypothetical protein
VHHDGACCACIDDASSRDSEQLEEFPFIWCLEGRVAEAAIAEVLTECLLIYTELRQYINDPVVIVGP